MRERILFATDTNQDTSRLEMTKKLLKRFVLQKQQLIPRQEFGILLLNDGTIWHLPFTTDPNLINSSIDDIVCQENVVWNVSSLFDLIHDVLPTSDILRIILIYTRSNCIPKCNPVEFKSFYEKYANVYLDCVYLHDKPSETNQVQQIFDQLGHIESPKARSFEITRNYKRYLLAMTELLGNPSQRSEKSNCHIWNFQS